MARGVQRKRRVDGRHNDRKWDLVLLSSRSIVPIEGGVTLPYRISRGSFVTKLGFTISFSYADPDGVQDPFSPLAQLKASALRARTHSVITSDRLVGLIMVLLETALFGCAGDLARYFARSGNQSVGN